MDPSTERSVHAHTQKFGQPAIWQILRSNLMHSAVNNRDDGAPAASAEVEWPELKFEIFLSRLPPSLSVRSEHPRSFLSWNGMAFGKWLKCRSAQVAAN